MKSLTDRQKKILCFIEDYTTKAHRSPTYKEIQDHFGFASANAVREYINLLSNRGYLAVQRTNTGRCKSFDSSRQSRTVPLVGTIAAGTPVEAIENSSAHIDLSGVGIDNSKQDHFALTVQGTSMIDAHIADGDMVIIKKQSSVKDGEIAAVLWNGEATLKYVKILQNGSILLVPANKQMKPMKVVAEKVVSFQILGKVVKVIRSY